ncbi:MAG: hypothetical protein JKY01_00120 [Pseudomonadales bacterium]|nr:hypothetical protein [Pseudomonadales bacterium]
MEWDASVSTGLLYTSNAFSDQNASVSEVQRDMSLSADVSHQSKRATIDGGYQVKRAYYPNSYATDTTSQGRSNIDIVILPGNIIWTGSHQRTDTLRNFNANDTPDNRATRENFKTGPVISIKLTPTDMLQSSFMKSWTTTEFDPDRDSETDTLAVNYNRAFSALLNVSLALSQSDVSFDRALGYETSSQMISLNRTIKDGSILLALGNNEVDQLSITSRSPSINLTAYKKLLDTSFSVGYSKLLTHTSIDLSDLGQDVPNFGLINLTEIVEKETFRGGLSKTINGGLSLHLNAYTDVVTSQSSNLSTDRKGIIASGNYTRPLSPSSSSNADYVFNYLESWQGDGLDKSTTHSFSLGYTNQISQALSVTASTNYMTRSGSENYNFDQTSIVARLVYAYR